ncbi:MAG: hypothetical protein K2G25_05275 [Oscillospiraceae bacterium]|nr:hypothetical protein [Oscillospiraceae bacterium]
MTKLAEYEDKPECPLIWQNGNIFVLMGVASKTLKKHHMQEQAAEMRSRVTSSHSYEEALGVILEYVNPVSVEEYEDEEIYMEMEMS